MIIRPYGEIQIGIDAVDGAGGGVVGSGGFLLDIVRAQVSLFAVVFDVGDPFVAALVVGDAEVLAGRSSALAAVGVVLGVIAVATVALAVVQAVVILVVADQVVGRVHDQAVHVDALPFASDANVTHGVAIVHVHLAAPAELREPDVVLRIDLGEPALGQRDLAVGAEGVREDGQARFASMIYDF